MARRIQSSTLAFVLIAVQAFVTAHAVAFRAIDGSGNNLANPAWGTPDTELLRLTSPAYADGLGSPRTAQPSARAISNAVSSQVGSTSNSNNASDWLWQWGQFLDHDLDLTGPHSPAEPFNVSVPTGDPSFDPFVTGGQEIQFNRSAHHLDGAGVRQQLNEISSYIDGSNVYGSDAARAAALRNADGTLRMSLGNNGEVLMGLNTLALENDIGGNSNVGDFFLAGDVRANEQIGLTAAHTLFAREHNRLVDDLAMRLGNNEAPLIAARDAAIADIGNGVNSEGDFLYQAARRVVGAKIQKITYDEFLPTLLGVDLTSGPVVYDDSVDAGISNEFSTAAYRFGHTMLSPELLRIDGSSTSSVSLRDAFFNPQEVKDNGIDSLLLGLASQKAQKIDTLLVDDVRNFLFGPPGAGGLDLASLNIQRGRDHGLADINSVRADLGLTPYVDFLDLTGGDIALADSFATVYQDIDNVDLWIGGLAEITFGPGMLGETFSYILRDQFERLMVGDRFFYLNDLEVLALFDPNFEQMSRLSDVILANSSVRSIQSNVFEYVPEPSTLLLLFPCALFLHRRTTS